MRKPVAQKRGRGKPALFDAPMRRVNVMLDKQTIELLTQLGRGNLSAGIREAARVISAPIDKGS